MSYPWWPLAFALSLSATACNEVLGLDPATERAASGGGAGGGGQSECVVDQIGDGEVLIEHSFEDGTFGLHHIPAYVLPEIVTCGAETPCFCGDKVALARLPAAGGTQQYATAEAPRRGYEPNGTFDLRVRGTSIGDPQRRGSLQLFAGEDSIELVQGVAVTGGFEAVGSATLSEAHVAVLASKPLLLYFSAYNEETPTDLVFDCMSATYTHAGERLENRSFESCLSDRWIAGGGASVAVVGDGACGYNALRVEGPSGAVVSQVHDETVIDAGTTVIFGAAIRPLSAAGVEVTLTLDGAPAATLSTASGNPDERGYYHLSGEHAVASTAASQGLELRAVAGQSARFLVDCLSLRPRP